MMMKLNNANTNPTGRAGRRREKPAKRAQRARGPDLAKMRNPVTAADQRAVHEARRVIAALQTVEPRRRRPRARQVLPTHGWNVHPAYDAWVRSLHYPSGHRGVQCPVNENPAPSNVVLSPTVTWNSTNVIVEAGKCVQIVLFPGRDVQADGGMSFDNCANPAGTIAAQEPGPGDEVAVHSRLRGFCSLTQVVPDSVVATAPIPADLSVNVLGVNTPIAVDGAIGLISSGQLAFDALATGRATCWAGGAAGATGAGKWVAMLPDNPIGLRSAHEGHMRWKLTSMDLYARNTTAEAERGGHIVTVMPTNKFYESGVFEQMKLDRYGTYRIHGDEAYAAWVPRPGELAYGHVATSNTSATSSLLGLHYSATPYLDGAAMYCWLNNPTGNTQSFTVSVCQNYDIAGQGVSQLGVMAEHHPQLMPAVQSGIAIATSGAAPIGPAMAAGAARASQGALAKTARNTLASAEKYAKSLVSHAADTVGATVKGAIFGT